jgi:hypothetical protein
VAYPGLAWEPKAAFAAVADFDGGHMAGGS